jgi:hypothetical protein
VQGAESDDALRLPDLSKPKKSERSELFEAQMPSAARHQGPAAGTSIFALITRVEGYKGGRVQGCMGDGELPRRPFHPCTLSTLPPFPSYPSALPFIPFHPSTLPPLRKWHK